MGLLFIHPLILGIVRRIGGPRLAWMKQGESLSTAPTNEIFENPQHPIRSSCWGPTHRAAPTLCHKMPKSSRQHRPSEGLSSRSRRVSARPWIT